MNRLAIILVALGLPALAAAQVPQPDIVATPLAYVACDTGIAALPPGRLPKADLNGTYRQALDTTILSIWGSRKVKRARIVRTLGVGIVEPGRAPLPEPTLILQLDSRRDRLPQAETLPLALILPDSTLAIPPAMESPYGGRSKETASMMGRVPYPLFRLLVGQPRAALLVGTDTIALSGQALDDIRVLFLAARCGWRRRGS